MKPIITFIKKETILTISWILAIGSMFFVRPNIGYLEYIDFRTLGILWSLMIIMEGLKQNGFFAAVGAKLLLETKKIWQLVAVLVGLCFFSSMLITNDVALLTFVPFAIFILEQCDREKLLIPVITLQTLAANLGSMMTPIGNPQNLYLFGYANMTMKKMVSTIFPYEVATVILLVIMILTIKDKTETIDMSVEDRLEHAPIRSNKNRIYGILFIVSILSVFKLVPYYVLGLIVLVAILIVDNRVLISVDYALLFTFMGFFIFTGNLGALPAVRDGLTQALGGHELSIAILASQFISNVPAALLLSGFTDNYYDLLLGVNLGGLGTLIASMASLISYKSLAHIHNDLKGRYLVYFTLINVFFLAVLLGLRVVL